MTNKLLPNDVLSDARRRGVDWMEVARAFGALQAETSSIPAGTTPTRWAAKLSGYSSNHLRRMAAGRQFYLELMAANPALAHDLGMPRFSHLEMLAKLWRLDRDRVLHLLERQPKLSHAGLTQLFESVQSQSPASKAAGKRLQAQFRNLCTGSLVKQPDPVLCMGTGTYTLIAPRVHNDPFCKPDLLIKLVDDSEHPLWSGIDCFVAENPYDDAFGRKLIALATASTFLTQHWLCVPDNHQVIEHVRSVADQLQLVNLGILTLTEAVLVTVRQPSGLPVHDRRHLWQPPRLWHDISEIAAR